MERIFYKGPVVLVAEVVCPSTKKKVVIKERCGSVGNALWYRENCFCKKHPGHIETLDGRIIFQFEESFEDAFEEEEVIAV